MDPYDVVCLSQILENFHRFPDLFHLGNPANPGCIASQGHHHHGMTGKETDGDHVQSLSHPATSPCLSACHAFCHESRPPGGKWRQHEATHFIAILEDIGRLHDISAFQHFSFNFQLSTSFCAKALRCLIGLSHFATKYHITKATFVPNLQPDCRGSSTTCKHLWDANACNCHYCHSTLTPVIDKQTKRMESVRAEAHSISCPNGHKWGLPAPYLAIRICPLTHLISRNRQK